MSVSPDQLSEIYRHLRDFIDSQQAVSIKPMKGDPPEQYEVTYNISGFSKPGKGEPYLTTGHKIEMTIPFGFPHFPPSCKPKSDIFHPDFDPAAICLGEFWHQHRQIPDLIVFIGRLINGESFSTVNAFNEQAATWYQEHSDSFPIAKIHWSDRQPNQPETIQAPKAQIDTLNDDDLTPDFSFLSMASDSPGQFEQSSLQTSLPPESPLPDADLAFLDLLTKQKKFFKIRQTLGGNQAISAQVQDVISYAEEAIKRADQLYKLAKKAEYDDDLQNALRLYEQVGATTSDFPNLEADQKRVSQSIALFEEINQPATPDFSDSDFDSSHENLPPVPNKAASRGAKSKQHNNAQVPNSFSPIQKILSSKFTITFTAGILCVILLCGGGYYLFLARKLESSNTAFSKCANLIEKEQFEDAKQTCSDAFNDLEGLTFFQQERINELRENINNILQSEKLSQGLAGNVLVNGKYISKKDAVILNNYALILKEGGEFFDQEKWSEAEECFNKLLTVSGKNTLLPASTIEDIKSKLSFTRFSLAFNAAKALLANQKWQEAATELKKAKIQFETLPEKDRRKYSVELNTALAKLNFEEYRKQGDDFFSKADWLNAISSYKSVLPSVENGNLAPPETLEALRENISRAELYATIDKGNKAFAAGSWDEAIQEYYKAEAILTSSQALIKFSDPDVTRRKIERIILQTTIVRDRQAATSQQKDKKDLVTARNIYRQIVANITKSGFATETEFSEIKRESLAAIQSLDEKIYQADKEQYLKDNFRNLFTENYPATIPENLNNPVVTYVKESDGKMIFRMQCIETGAGRPLMLIMLYAYDKANNRWAFFSEQQ
ncbi:MAG: ubiquitin-conjugating enzyme E2 [Desulforhopalus sp.]|nr:ubiquitin-conjugating enzyme E2 [Desulforhopalus sp.]